MKPPKPLRETTGGSPLLEKARELVDAVEPVPESAARMQRVRRALEAPPKGVSVPGLGRVPALGVAIVVALFGASAFAAVRYVVTNASEQAPAAAPTGAPRASVPAVPQEVAASKQVAPGEDETAAVPGRREPDGEPAAVEPEPGVTIATDGAGDEAHAAPHRKHRTKSTRPPVAEPEPPEASADTAEPAPEPQATPPGQDSLLVHRAVQALRRDGDPALAARLLAEHARRYPRGPLAEEALSLQVEAAVALGDPRARTFAREYLRRYPNGRYAGIARRALE